MPFPRLSSLLSLSLLLLPITLTSSLPTIVIVPGAWQSPIHYTKLTTYLRSAGYPVLAHAHPSIDSSNPTGETASFDAAVLRYDVIQPLVTAQGEEIVLVMHGYGGLVGPAAVAGNLSRKWRRGRNLRGGVLGMVFLAGYLNKKGGSLVELLPGGRLEEWVVQYPNGQTYPSSNPAPLFYNDIPPDLAALFVHELRNQSAHALSTRAGYTMWPKPDYDNRRAFAFTTKDQIVPVPMQRAMVTNSGVDFVGEDFETGHSPFLSVPEELGGWILGLVGGWSGMEDGEGGIGGGGNGTVDVA